MQNQLYSFMSFGFLAVFVVTAVVVVSVFFVCLFVFNSRKQIRTHEYRNQVTDIGRGKHWY